MTRAILAAIFAFVLIAASTPTLVGPAVQGGLIRGQAEPGSRVFQDGKPVRVDAQGRFLIAFAYDAAPSSEIRIVSPEGAVAVEPVAVRARDFEVQRIDNLPSAKVSPGPDDLARIAIERERLEAYRTRTTDAPLFSAPFRWPVTGVVSGLYGSRRILNGEPRAPHLGVDIAAGEGTPVASPTDGVVSLVDDQFFTGNTVMLDHGLGLTSVYAHLSRIDVAVGERVAAGRIIGAVGQTGRATAAHLHWGVYLMGTGVDPALLAGPMPLPPDSKLAPGQ